MYTPIHTIARFKVAIALTLSTIGSVISVLAQTSYDYKTVTLDCGGYFSGLDKANDGRIYGFGDIFGAWRSDNGGQTWSYLNWSITEPSIDGQAIAVQKDNSNVVFYQTGDALYKSTNGGANWTKILDQLGIVTAGMSDQGAPRYRGSSPILIRPNNEVWLAAPRKNLKGTLWRSINGAAWTKLGGTQFDNNAVMTLHESSAFPGQIWVGTAKGLFVSVNNGTSFTRIGTASALTDVGMISRFTAAPYAGIGVISCSNNGGGLRRITAGNFATPSTYSITAPTTTGFNIGYPTGLQIFSNGTCSAWNTDASIHAVSSNGGTAFSKQATTVNTSVVPIWFTAAGMTARNHPDYGTDQVIELVGQSGQPNKRIITGGFAPMYSSDEGLSWQYFPNGTGAAGVKTYAASVSRFSTSVMYVPGSDIGMAVVTDGGISGNASYCSARSNPYLHGAQEIMEGPDQGKTLVLAGVDQQNNRNLILRSTDYGNSWGPLDLNPATTSLPACDEGITKSVMSLTSADDFLVVLGEGSTNNTGVWRTTNGGKTFQQATGLPSSLSTGFRYGAQSCFIDRDAVNSSMRYFVARGTAFYRSADGGSSWNTTGVTHPFTYTGGFDWVWGMAADPVRSQNIWAAGDYRGISVSRNGGASWTPTTTYYTGRYVSSCDGKVAFLGQGPGDTFDRIYYSTDDGATFVAVTDANKYFDGVQGITVDRNGRIWVSNNSVTVITPTTNIALSNAGFESAVSQTPPGWSSSAANSAHLAADYVEEWTPHSGTRHLSHWMPSNAYQIYTYQTVTNIPNGTYTAKAWTISSGGQNLANMTVKNYGGSDVSVPITASDSSLTYVERVISNIHVTNGQIEIGFYSDALANQWIAADDVSLVRTGP